MNALYDKMIGLPGTGTELENAPSRLEVKSELMGYDLQTPANLVNADNLYDRLTANCPTDCNEERTRAIVKAMCSSVLGSAAMLLQ